MQRNQRLIDAAVASAHGENNSFAGLNEFLNTETGRSLIGEDFELCFTLDDLNLQSSEAKYSMSVDSETEIRRNEEAHIRQGAN